MAWKQKSAPVKVSAALVVATGSGVQLSWSVRVCARLATRARLWYSAGRTPR